MKYLSEKNTRRLYPVRASFADWLWLAFPSSSENELAMKAGPALGVSDRQVINWLRCRNEAKLSQVIAVIALVGVELVSKTIEGP